MEAGNRGRKLSRREVVFGGMLAAGAVAAGAPGFGLASRAEARETPLPWPYEKIDPRAAAKIAYEGFYEALCSYGVSRAIWVPLREKVGEPYVSHPLYEGLKLGGAGIAGWGTVCGALLGATVVTGFYDGPRNLDRVTCYTWERRRGGPSGEFEEAASAIV